MYKMTEISIHDYNTIDIDNIKFNNPNKIKGGSFMSLADYNMTPIYIQTPRLISTKGIVKTDSRCTLELEFDRNHWKFYEFMTNVDDHNVLQINKNSLEWFSKEFPLDIVEEFYNTPIKMGRGKKPPSLKVKIPIVKGELDCCIYNTNNNIITHNDIKVGSKILCVLKFQGLRFLKQQVICEWVPIQIKVFQTGQDSVYLINDNLHSDIEHVNDSNTIELIDTYDETTNLNNLEPNELNELNDEKSNELNDEKSNELNELNGEEPNELNGEEPNELNTLELNELNTLELNDEISPNPLEEKDVANSNDEVVNPNELKTLELNEEKDVVNSNDEDVSEKTNEECIEMDQEYENIGSMTDVLEENTQLQELKIKYEEIIKDRELKIDDLMNKFNKLKEFIN